MKALQPIFIEINAVGYVSDSFYIITRTHGYYSGILRLFIKVADTDAIRDISYELEC